ncbi:MAG: 50S ribosomal protein P1 [Candidatus Micrarchaeota archaeon]|nr:50S ribosomal protein P1 [Candidatus Micrarchaeota archaeon]
MEYVYAALLLHSAKKDINKENVTSVLKAAGLEVNSAKVEALVSALDGVNIDEALKNAAVAAVAAPVAAAPAAGAAKEEKKEEKSDEKKEEEAAAGLANLFG